MFKFFARLARLFAAKSTAVTGHRADRVRLTIDAEGWLHGTNVVHYPSVRCYDLHSGAPEGIVWHYTATKVGTAKSLAKRIRTYKRGKDRAASWHVLIAHDGTIYQSVPFLKGAWHCAKGRPTTGIWRTNRCTVGIELEGMGDEFSPAQKGAAWRLWSVLQDIYDMLPEFTRLRHSDLDPKRRKDPGPVWTAIMADWEPAR